MFKFHSKHLQAAYIVDFKNGREKNFSPQNICRMFSYLENLEIPLKTFPILGYSRVSTRKIRNKSIPTHLNYNQINITIFCFIYCSTRSYLIT